MSHRVIQLASENRFAVVTEAGVRVSEHPTLVAACEAVALRDAAKPAPVPTPEPAAKDPKRGRSKGATT